MTRVGLVLGGGGVVGQAYHAGVLAVLEHDFGFDARTADMIVGTSAGSITGTPLRAVSMKLIHTGKLRPPPVSRSPSERGLS